MPIHKKINISRFYNSLTFSNTSVIKGTSPERHRNETLWFAKAEKIIPDNIPKIFHVKKDNTKGTLSYYEMQRIDGNNLFEWLLNNKTTIKKDILMWFTLIEKLHTETKEVHKSDIFGMYYDKPSRALRNFLSTSMIDPDAIIINGQNMSNPIHIFESTYQKLAHQLKDTRYSFIHGDSTLGNTLRSTNGRLYLIDPRGIFGSTRYYGDVRYDIAKMYFSLVGSFDSLNNEMYTLNENVGKSYSYHYSIKDQGFGEFGTQLIEFFSEDLDLIKYIHITIWISLIPHMANNPKQQLCAFLHSTQLLNTLKNYE